jgi:hypothetical protein
MAQPPDRSRSREQNRERTFVRILLLIDTLAGSTHGMTAGQITKRINELARETYHCRTIRRDMDALESVGFAIREDRKPNSKNVPTIFWRLNLKRSERLQEVAFEMVEAN